ncbi:MAG: response regulator [Candidatus Sulfotelmatobacter sp.]
MAEIPLVSIIDDSHSVRRELATVIWSAGFVVEVFGSVKEFIRSNQVSCTSCLVISVQLPGMNGLQLQSHLASTGRKIPIVFVNVSSDERARALALELGAVNVLDKASGDQALSRRSS